MKYVYIVSLPFLIAIFLVSGCASTPIKTEALLPELTGEPKPKAIKAKDGRDQLANRNLRGVKAKAIEDILRLHDDQIDLATAILLISRKDYRNLFNPYIYVDIDKYTKIVDEITLGLIKKIDKKSEPKKIIQLINQYISRNFSHTSAETDPRSRFLNFVLDEKKGSSMGLSLLYLSIAERIGIQLYGVNAYDTIFIRYKDAKIKINVDTQHMEDYLGDDFYRDKSKTPISDKFFLKNMGKREVIASFLDAISFLYINKKLLNDAISDSNLALKISPQFFRAYNTRGTAYIKKGKLDKAIPDFDEAIDINPMYATAYYNRATVYREKGELDKAISDLSKARDINISDYTKAIEINPRDATAYYNRGISYSQKGELDKAISDFTRAIEINPWYVSAYNARGTNYSKQGQQDKAISDYTKSIKIKKKDSNTYYNRGISYSQKGELDKAISDFTRAIEINPNFANAYDNRGIAYSGKHQYNKAISDFTRAIETDPDFVKAYHDRATSYRKKGQLDKAISDFTKVIELNPGLAESYSNRGAIYNKKGELDKAISDFSRVIELNPRDDKAYFNKAVFSDKAGNIADAIEAYRNFIKYAHPNHAKQIDLAKDRIQVLEKTH